MSKKGMIQGSIIVVAKCPIAGKSKTRLVPLLGKDGSAKLAKAMLSDVLMTLERCVSSVGTSFIFCGKNIYIYIFLFQCDFTQ